MESKNGRVILFCLSTNPDMETYFHATVRAAIGVFGERRILVVSPREGPWAGEVDCVLTPKWCSPRSPQELLYAFPYMREIFREVGGRNIDLSFFATANPIQLLIALFLGSSRKIFAIHDWAPHPGRFQLPVRIYNWTVSKIVANLILVFSKKAAAAIPGSRHMVLAGFDSQPSFAKTASGVNHESPYVVLVGRLEEYKGLECLPELNAALESLPQPIRLVVAGRGDASALSGLLQSENFRLINRFIEEGELPALLGGATAVVLPYSSATQSGVIPLAYSMGTPVVAFDVGALSEYIVEGHTGFTVAPSSVSEMVQKIEDISSRLPEFRKNATARFREAHSRKAAEAAYAEFFKIYGEA